MKPKGNDYSQVDWEKSNRELADELDVTVKTVYKARLRRGIPLSKPGHGRGNKNARVDWRLSPKTRPVTDLDYEFAMGSKGKGGRRKPTSSWRKAVVRTHGEACVLCGYHKPPISNHAHHIIPMSEGGKNTIRNGIVLCSRCHDEVHAGITSLLHSD